MACLQSWHVTEPRRRQQATPLPRVNNAPPKTEWLDSKLLILSFAPSLCCLPGLEQLGVWEVAGSPSTQQRQFSLLSKDRGFSSKQHSIQGNEVSLEGTTFLHKGAPSLKRPQETSEQVHLKGGKEINKWYVPHKCSPSPISMSLIAPASVSHDSVFVMESQRG